MQNDDDDDDDSEMGLSSMMARSVAQTTSRSRGRSSDGLRDQGSGRSRDRSRSSSILRRLRNKKKDSNPTKPHGERRGDSDDDKSVASRKSVRSSRSKATKKKKTPGQSLTRSGSKSVSVSTESTRELQSPTKSGDDAGGKDEKKKLKKKSKKIKRIRKTGADGDGSGEDERTILSKQSTKSSRSSDNSLLSRQSKVSKAGRSRSVKSKASKHFRETSSRVESIREPQKSGVGVIIQDELDSLFPLPSSPVSTKPAKTVKATRGLSAKYNGVDTDSDEIPKSTTMAQSQRSLTSTGGGSTGSFGIMTNKAAEEQAEAALSRVAKSGFGEASSRRERQFTRRYSNDSITRRNEQYDRLHQNSGLTSLTSINDDDTRSYNSGRRQTNVTAMSALHKRMDEYKIETEALQKRLYEALAEVEQKNIELRKEKERANIAEGDLNAVKEELEQIDDEKSFLIESVRDMEKEFVEKDERAEKLQEVVEMQLDTVEMLEKKLEKTEEKLIVMEDEMSTLIDAVEDKNKSNERIDKVVSKGRGSTARVESMRIEMNSRRGTLMMKKEESRRVLLSSENQGGRPRKTSTLVTMSEAGDTNPLENELKEREEKLNVIQEKCNQREQRLDTWEKELFDLEDQLKKDGGRNGAGTTNLEQETLITSLEKEKERLRVMQIDNHSKLKKLEFENENLRGQLERMTKMTENVKELPSKSKDLTNALALVEEKDKTIKSLKEKIDELGKKDDIDKSAEEGTTLLIRQLQIQLETSKKEAASLTSGGYATRLKIEIKKLRESIKVLKQRVKEEEEKSKKNMQKKEDSMKLLQKQMQKLKIELERREKRDKNFGTNSQLNNSDLQRHIDDLEDEISHWKSTNADLEYELESMKARVGDLETDDLASEEDFDDSSSIGSLASVNSRMSMAYDDNFSLSDSMHGSMQDDPDSVTPNRALRTVTNLWSKMRNAPEPPNTVQAFPYAPGSLND